MRSWSQQLRFEYQNYLRQVNGVNNGDTVFIGCVSVCACACMQRKTVKVTDFKFDVPHGQSGHDCLKIFRKGGMTRVA